MLSITFHDSHPTEWIMPVKIEFLKKLTYANLKRNMQAQIRYTLRNKNLYDECEELVQHLTDVVNSELSNKVGPEDVLSESQLEELQYALNEAARRILKTNRLEKLDRRVKRAIEKTLLAPQVEQLHEVCPLFVVHIFTIKQTICGLLKTKKVGKGHKFKLKLYDSKPNSSSWPTVHDWWHHLNMLYMTSHH